MVNSINFAWSLSYKTAKPFIQISEVCLGRKLVLTYIKYICGATFKNTFTNLSMSSDIKDKSLSVKLFQRI